MDRSTATIVKARTATEIGALFELSPEALRLLTPQQSPAAFFNLLVEQKLYRDATRFSAHLLHPIMAVWWGCVCVWQVLKPTPDVLQSAALRAAVRWVMEPNEELGRAAESAGKAAGAATPAGAVALAAFYSGSSLAPPNLPAVPPPPDLTAKTVAAGVLLAAAQGPPAQSEFRFRQFLSMAIEVTQNWGSWNKAAKSDGRP